MGFVYLEGTVKLRGKELDIFCYDLVVNLTQEGVNWKLNITIDHVFLKIG